MTVWGLYKWLDEVWGVGEAACHSSCYHPYASNPCLPRVGIGVSGSWGVSRQHYRGQPFF